MKRIVRLTESDLTRIVRRVIMEQAGTIVHTTNEGIMYLGKVGLSIESVEKDPKTKKPQKVILSGKASPDSKYPDGSLKVKVSCLDGSTYAYISFGNIKNKQTTVAIDRLQRLEKEFSPIRQTYCK